jgi:release factor glutamine methyltransferase
MIFRELLNGGYRALVLAEVDTPFLDAVVLLAHAMDATKEKLFASLPDPVPEGVQAGFKTLLDRRAAGAPVSYIRGKKEFFGLEFTVDERVLVPRPDTEILVERALRICGSEPGIRTVHDACTGSGCVVIALKLMAPELEISASDISPAAAEVFRLNAEKLLGGPASFHLSDLLEGVPGAFDLIVANPPYLQDAEVDDLRRIGWPEPELSLRGGKGGTDIAERLIDEAPRKLTPGGWLALEAAPGQFEELSAAMERSGFRSIGIDKDLAGRDRVISGTHADGGNGAHG